MKTIGVVMLIGFVLSFWWLGPMVVASFIGGMLFYHFNRRKIGVLIGLWKEES